MRNGNADVCLDDEAPYTERVSEAAVVEGLQVAGLFLGEMIT